MYQLRLPKLSTSYDLRGATNTQQLLRQNFCSRRTPHVELYSSPTTQSGHHLRTVQTRAKGAPFSGSMNTMTLCDFDMRRLRRTLTYLCRNVYCCPPDTKATTYISLVRPHHMQQLPAP